MYATRDTVSALVSFLVWLVVMGPSKCCQEVMHGKCSWNITRSQRRQEQGGWWCTKRRQKGIAPGHFLKAPSNLTHSVAQSRSRCFSTMRRAHWREGESVLSLPGSHPIDVCGAKTYNGFHCSTSCTGFKYGSGNKWFIFKSTQRLVSSAMPNCFNCLHVLEKL